MRFGGLDTRALYNAVKKVRFPVGPTRMPKTTDNKPSEQKTTSWWVFLPFTPRFFIRTVLLGTAVTELPFLKPASALSHVTELSMAGYADKEGSLLRP